MHVYAYIAALLQQQFVNSALLDILLINLFARYTHYAESREGKEHKLDS